LSSRYRYLAVSPDFSKALAAINRSAFTGLKGYLGILSTLGAYRRIHLTGSVAAGGAVTLGLSCLTASETPFGLIGVAF